MQNPPPQEAAFFETLDAETPIEIHVRTAAMSVSNLRREVLRHCSGELLADTSETSVARYFKRGCSRFKSLHGELKDLTDEIVKLGPDGVPALLFRKLGPAMQWTLKDVRRYLVAYNGDEHPVNDCKQAFEDYKDNCRPETQPDGLTRETFAARQCALFETLAQAGFRLAQAIEAVDDRRTMARDLEAARSASTARGVGRSHFAQIGQEYKGVKVSDATHLVLYGRRLEITAQGNWNFIDRSLQAHFADEPFTVTRANVLNLSTPDEKFLLSAIHRETVEEAGQKRRGNKRYTGRAWFAKP